MNFDKVIKLCKKEKKFIVYKESPKVNFLGTEQVMYLVPNKTSCAPEYLTSLGGLSPSDVSSTKFITKDFPDKLNFTDTDADEIFTALPAIKMRDLTEMKSMFLFTHARVLYLLRQAILSHLKMTNMRFTKELLMTI